jgi:hypothetical protein
MTGSATFLVSKPFSDRCNTKNRPHLTGYLDSADIYILPEGKLEEDDEGVHQTRVRGRHLKTTSFN